MAAVFVLVWLVAGIVGVNLTMLLCEAHNDMSRFEPWHVWFAVTGPLILVVALLMAIEAGLEKETRQ